MIYCVIPEPLADELYPRLASYYENDPNVEVIIDRRSTERRAGEGEPPEEARREQRDRRRARVTGDFPRVDPVDALDG